MEDNHISDPRARAFVAALRRFEQTTDPTALAELFAPDATLMRLDGQGERAGTADFWTEYRGYFHQLSTTFFNAVEGADQCALEWSSTGTLTDDRPITYLGVTVLDFDGENIVRLRTYYDSAAFTFAGRARRSLTVAPGRRLALTVKPSGSRDGKVMNPQHAPFEQPEGDAPEADTDEADERLDIFPTEYLTVEDAAAAAELAAAERAVARHAGTPQQIGGVAEAGKVRRAEDRIEGWRRGSR